MASAPQPAAAAAGRVLRSQATREKRREEDEESGGDEEGAARRDAARRRKRRKDDGVEEDVGAERKEEGKAEEGREAGTSAPRAPGDDGLVDILEPLFLLRNNISTFISRLKPPAEPAAGAPAVSAPVQQWGALVSQYPQQMNVPLTGTVFAIGRNSKCNMQLRELSVSSLLCNLVWQDGTALIECCSNSGILSVNNRPLKKGARQGLKSGDEISISGLKPYLFVYQQLPSPQLVSATAGVSVPGSPGQAQSQGTTGAPLNLSMSAPPAPELLVTKPAGAGADAEATAAAVAAKNRKRWLFADSNSDGEAIAPEGDAPFSIRDSTAGLKLPRGSLTSWPNLPTTPIAKDSSSVSTSASGGAAGAAVAAATPVGSAAIPPSPAVLLSSTTSTPVAVETPRPTAAAQTAKDQAKEEFIRALVPGKSIPVSFDKFPYFLSDDVKRQLINCVYVYLLRPELGKFTAELPTVSRRILLTGPPGTEMYQETLARALAHHFQCNLLVFDPAKIAPLDGSDTRSAAGGDVRSAMAMRHADSIDDPDADLWALEGKDRRVFRKGDKVKFVGPAFSSAVTGIFRQLHTLPERREARGPPPGAKGKVLVTFDENNRRVGVRFEKPVPGGNSLGGLCEDAHGFFADAAELRHDVEGSESADSAQIEALFEAVSESQPCILFLRDTDKCITQSFDRYAIFRRLLDRVGGKVVVIGSSVASDGGRRDKSMSPGLVLSKGSGAHTHTTLLDFSFLDHFSRIEERTNRENSKQARILARVLPTKVTISAPTDATEQLRWKKQIEKDVEMLKLESNHLLMRRVLERSSVDAPVLPEHKLLKEQVLPLESVEKIVGYAVSHHAMSADAPDIRGDRLCLSVECLTAGVDMLSTAQAEPPSQRALRDIDTENEFEKRLLGEVIPPADIGVRFDDIGALDSVKETLRELVMLPLQRPELFRKGALTRPCKGILMFGPPGTGKTMLARAVATESGANFINLSMSSIASKWFGEGEKFARAVFTLASKIAPSVIFIDEVDSILGKRERNGEHEAMRKIKNEFMSMWDGLKTKENERVLVLAATNRPFDLDDAVLRRMPRRLLVDLPDAVNREKILRVLLAKEDIAENFDYTAVAQMTEGYSGSDLKSLCVAAAYIPIREILEREKKDNVREAEPLIRKLTLEDFKRAKNDICASVSEDAASIGELRKWNEMYGEGGKRGSHSRLSYFM